MAARTNFNFSIMGNATSDSQMTIGQQAQVPSSTSIKSMISTLKDSLNTSTDSEINSQLSSIQSKIDSSLTSYSGGIKDFLTSVFTKLFDALKSELSGNTSQDISVSASGLSSDELLQNSKIVSNISLLLDNYSPSTERETTRTWSTGATKKGKTFDLSSQAFGGGLSSGISSFSTEKRGTTDTSSESKDSKHTRDSKSKSSMSQSNKDNFSKLLDLLNTIKAYTTSNTQLYSKQRTQPTKQSSNVKTNGKVDRPQKKSLSSLSSDVGILSQNVRSLSSNDRTLANGVCKVAQVVTSFSKSVGNNKTPDISTTQPASVTTPLYYEPATTSTTSQSTNKSTTNQGASALAESISRLQNNILSNASKTTSAAPSTTNTDSLRTGLQSSIANLQSQLAKESDSYNSKVQSGSATLQDTMKYLNDSGTLSANIQLLQTDLSKLKSSSGGKQPRTGFISSRMEKLGANIGNSTAGKYTKTLFKGKPDTRPIPSKLKNALKKFLSESHVNEPSPYINTKPDTKGTLSSLTVSTTTDGDTTTVQNDAVIEDQAVSFNYQLSTSQLNDFIDNLDIPQSQSQTNKLYVFIFAYLFLYVYSGLYSNNKLKINNATYDPFSIISAFSPKTFSSFTSNVLPKATSGLSKDSKDVTSAGFSSSFIKKILTSSSFNNKYLSKLTEGSTDMNLFNSITGSDTLV